MQVSAHAPSAAPVVAYLGPEIPALSATFVHEELLALERRGVKAVPFSVHRPAHPATAQTSLATRTCVLYDGSPTRAVLQALAALPHFGRGSLESFSWLLSDMLTVRPWRLQAWKLGYQWLAAAHLARLLQDAGCTHLHVHFAHVPTQIGMYAAAFTGLPFTVMAHANDIFERALLLPQKARRAQKMLTISHHNVAYLRSLGLPADKLAVVRCGVSFPARADRPSFEKRPRYRVGTLGRLVEKKGVDDLLRAMTRLRPGTEVELSIAGDGPLRTELEALTRQLGLHDRVRFEGALDHAAVTPWLHTLDAFVLACKTDAQGDMDGIPVVLMEAMSQCVPVLSTRLSGIPELVVHERTGLLASPADPASLAEQLQRLLDEPLLRERLATAAQAHVEAEFGQAVNIDRLMTHCGLVPAAADSHPSQSPGSMNRRYVLISPCRNEADFMRQTLDTVVAQSMRPARWVIVDDGSTDATPAILAEYQARHDWITVVTRKDRGRRAVGPGVIEAFYAGFDSIDPNDYDYLCKLDLDLSLPPRYFELLMQRMEADPRLATCSGKAYVRKGDALVNENHGDDMSLGMTKFYRVQRFQQIGGFVREVMWDGIDCHRCRMLGYSARSWDDPDLRFIHLRPMGSSQTGILTGRMRHGFGQYFMGTGFVYMLASALFRVREAPVVVGSAAMLWGWLKSALEGKPRYDDLAFRRFLRRYQWRALMVGKERALAEIYREQGVAAGLQP
ncbi:MAG: glycosyltransferase [Methylibium sp.]|uniref:glycosyltransferase n=1 Tax=Methylibium sp. TaxID=2067992 RepID=UPI001832E8DC|nr:glycosyltransferase [Methylibium sp.]MBA3597200.1 glycosyltransferase [Methylibium sp.]